MIANRAQSGGRFPGTYCGVLFQRGQFSFVHGHSLPSVPHSNKQWQTAVAIAKIVDEHLKESAAGDALFFHARYVSPGWHAKRVASIGNHIFYPLIGQDTEGKRVSCGSPAFLLATICSSVARWPACPSLPALPMLRRSRRKWPAE